MGALDQIFKFSTYVLHRATLPTPVADGAIAQALGDQFGRLVTVAPQPSGRVIPDALAYRGRILAQAGQLLSLHGFNDDASNDRYLMLFDQSALVDPANGTIPFERFRVPAKQSFSYEPGYPVSFANGIFWIVSSTGSTLTKDAAATFHVSGTYAS